MTKHLWEVEHPYYGPEACYYANGAQAEEATHTFSSWAEFAQPGVSYWDADLDMNYLYRWDWIRDNGKYRDEAEDREPDRLHLFYMGQRKGYMSYTIIDVTEEDEPAVIEWLTVRAKHTASMWAPLVVAE